MYSFPDLEPACCPMSSSNCCFLTCIQVSQDTSQVVWYSHLLKNFPQLVVIHTVKGFGIVNKAEIDVFLELSCFFDDTSDVGLENFKHHFTSVWDECNCVVVWAFFGIAFLWDWNENWHFPVLWPRRVFHICWHIEGSTFTASSFRIWNSSTGIPSPPLALFVVMLPKAHLISHSRMSGSRWVITP